MNMIILGIRSKVKVTLTTKWYATLCQPEMHPHTQFGIPTANNRGDMSLTRWTDSVIPVCPPPPQVPLGYKIYFYKNVGTVQGINTLPVCVT